MPSLRNRYWRLLRHCSSSFSLSALVLILVPSVMVSQLVTGCSVMSGLVDTMTPTSAPLALQKLSLNADRMLNNGAPVAVDLVLVLDQKLLVMLGALRAAEWFNNRHDFLRQYPNQLQVTSWEIVPGQVIKPMTVADDQTKLVGVLIFADYPGQQTFRANATGMSNVRVHLSKADFSIVAF